MKADNTTGELTYFEIGVADAERVAAPSTAVCSAGS